MTVTVTRFFFFSKGIPINRHFQLLLAGGHTQCMIIDNEGTPKGIPTPMDIFSWIKDNNYLVILGER